MCASYVYYTHTHTYVHHVPNSDALVEQTDAKKKKLDLIHNAFWWEHGPGARKLKITPDPKKKRDML